MADKEYADGLYGNEKEGQPDFVVGNIGIIKDKFIAWLQAQEADEKGWVNLNVVRQKGDPSKWSMSLDTWKPEKKNEAPEPDFSSEPPDGDDPNSPLPF